MPDHRQLGRKIAMCAACGKTVFSLQPNLILSGSPLKIAHKKCVQDVETVVL